jgi:hypothetical protein
LQHGPRVAQTAKRGPGPKSAANDPFYTKKLNSKSLVRKTQHWSVQLATNVRDQTLHHDPNARFREGAQTARGIRPKTLSHVKHFEISLRGPLQHGPRVAQTAKRGPGPKSAPNEPFYTKKLSSKSLVRKSRNLSVQLSTKMRDQTLHHDPTAKRVPGTKKDPNELFYIKKVNTKSQLRK